MSLYEEMVTVLKLKRRDGETFEDFATRASDKINKLPNEKWEELTEPLQVWNNKTLEARDTSSAIPPLDGWPAKEDEDEGDAADEAAEDGDAEESEEEGAEDAEEGGEPSEDVEGTEDGEEAEEAPGEAEEAPAAGKKPKKAAAKKPKASKPAAKKPEPAKAPAKSQAKAPAEKTQKPKTKEPKEKTMPSKSANGRGFDPNAKIKLLVKENPYREGSGRYKRWQKIKDGMTVAAALKAGFAPVNLRYCVSDGHIKIVKAA